MKGFLFFLLILGGCHFSSSERSTLRVAFATYPSTFEPKTSGDFASATVISLLYEGLTRCKGGADIELALAERVEISEDQKTYRFFLKESFWSDGEPVTAYDFERSWKSALDPQCPAISAYLFYPIQQAEDCVKGLVSMDEVGIHALDAQTLQVELSSPTPYFLSLTAFPLYCPVSQHGTNGPFCIDRISLNHEIVLKKNPTFWNPSSIALDAILIRIIPDEITALLLFEQGELDLVGGPLSPLPLDALETLKNDPQYRLISMNASTFCTFNTETFPFHNLSLRRAFSYAIDRQSIAAFGQTPASRCLPPAFCRSAETPQYNPELARHYWQQGLKELGIEPTALASLTLHFKTGQIDKRLAQSLQREWKEVFGIEIQLEQSTPKMHIQRLQERNYQIALASWIAQFDDPISLLDRFKEKKHAKNYPGWENAWYADRLNEATRITDEKKRYELLEQAEAKILQDAIIAPLYHWNSPALIHPRVKHFTTTNNGGVLFEKCSISRSYDHSNE